MQERGGMKGSGCCTPVIRGYRLLAFPDGTQAGVMGLNEILEVMWRAGKKPDQESAAEIVEKLSANNYVAPSARSLYEEAVLKEYARFVQGRTPAGCPESGDMVEADKPPKRRATGFISRARRLLKC